MSRWSLRPEPPGHESCLLPRLEPNPWIELRHETHAIACDLDASLIFGQPQTVPRDEEDGAPVQSEVSLYDLPSGQDLVWYPLPSELFLAGGMALVDLGRSAPFDPEAYFDGTLLLGRDSMISSYDAGTGVLEPEIDLAPYGVTRIEGLALDAERDALLIVDGEDSELVTLDLQVLRDSP